MKDKDGREATAFLLIEETIPEISALTAIDQDVLRGWLQYDQSFGLKSKVIVVEVPKGL